MDSVIPPQRLEPFRDGTRAFNAPALPSTLYQPFINQLLGQYKLIVMVGLPCTGKTTMTELYESSNNSVTKWSRQPIMDMIFSGGEYDEKFHSYIESFETDMIPAIMRIDSHQVIIDGYNRMPSARKKLVSYSQTIATRGKVCAVCFDGPEQSILNRMMFDPRYNMTMDQNEMMQMIERMKTTTVWPKFSEGFDDIYWINTFGEAGKIQMQTIVTKRDK